MAPYLAELARLRIKIFRDFPYLYEGSLDYEKDYLRTYLAAEGAALIVAEDAGRVVGTSTCLPLAAETSNIQKPFMDHGIDVGSVMYFGESVLEHDYRGRGLGVRFFEAREAHAAGFATAAFCAVNRAADHPARPAGYVPLDEFWRRRGYTKRDELVCEMTWTDIDDTQPSRKHLTFWTKPL